MKSFQVNTHGIEEVKRLLTDLYVKAGFKNTLTDYNLRDNEYKYIQFWFNNHVGWETTHSVLVFIHETYVAEEIGLDTAILRLKAAKNERITVVLNSEHTAVVSKSGIKVGCQTFPLDIVEKLAKARDEVLK